MKDATPPDFGNRSSMQEQRMSKNESDLLSIGWE
jgi:hypothetical protein